MSTSLRARLVEKIVWQMRARADRVQDDLALLILRGDVRDGDHVVVDRSGDKLSFNVIPGEREEEEAEGEPVYA